MLCFLVMHFLCCAMQVDHFERAKRLAEIPYLEQQYEQQKIDDEQFFKEQQQAKVCRTCDHEQMFLYRLC